MNEFHIISKVGYIQQLLLSQIVSFLVAPIQGA